MSRLIIGYVVVHTTLKALRIHFKKVAVLIRKQCFQLDCINLKYNGACYDVEFFPNNNIGCRPTTFNFIRYFNYCDLEYRSLYICTDYQTFRYYN